MLDSFKLFVPSGGPRGGAFTSFLEILDSDFSHGALPDRHGDELYNEEKAPVMK